jgi:hypothetical protein
MPPAHECLGTRDDATPEAHYGLVLQPELAALDAVLKVGEQVVLVGPLSRHG